jgi:folate-binding protein YgfZ
MSAPVSIQVEAARRAVLAVPRSDLATLVVTGKDRISWLNGMLTCELAKRAPGEVVYGLAVVRSGRVLSDATVVLGDTAAFVAVPATVVETVRTHLDHYLVMEDAEIAPGTDGFEPWMLHGPGAARVLEAARAAGGVGGAIDWTGFGGAFVLAPADRDGEVRAAIERAARDRDGFVGDDAGWEALRLERAVPRFGADFDDKTYPQEACLEKVAVSFEKGCYLGQEVVCMLELRGHVKRKLAPIVLDAEKPPAHGTAVTDEGGAPVGEITSASVSPTLGKIVGFAMVKRALAQPGTHVVVGGDRAEVVERPA